MNPEHVRIIDLAAGWEGSAAVVGVSSADAAILASVGCPVATGRRPNDPRTVKAPDLCAAARRLAGGFHETPPGGEGTPNVRSLTPTPGGAGGGGTEPGDDLDGKTVADLKAAADAAGVSITGQAKKADIIAAIRAARVAAAAGE